MWHRPFLQGTRTLFGLRPRRGRSPVEHKGNLYVRTSVRTSVPPPPEAPQRLDQASSGLSKAGSGLSEAGSDLSGAGSGLSEAGSGLSEAGFGPSEAVPSHWEA